MYVPSPIYNTVKLATLLLLLLWLANAAHQVELGLAAGILLLRKVN